MLRAIRCTQCDLGTALLVYWRCDPRYYYEAMRMGDKDALRYGEGWPVMREVLAKVERGGFKSADCSFNPANDRGTDWTKDKPALKTLGIPEIMCQPVRNGRADSRIGKSVAARRPKQTTGK